MTSPATAGAEKDVLLVGDSTMRPDEDEGNFAALNPNNLLRFVSSEDLRNTTSHISTCETFYGSLLDGDAVSARYTAEYLGGSLLVVPLDRALGLDCQGYTSDVSDHLPLLGRFRLMADDNEPATLSGAPT